MCGAYLYKRVSGLDYAKATDRPIDILAWQFFHIKNGGEPSTFNESGVIRFVAWGSHTLRMSLNASTRLTFGNVDDWEVDYDLATGRFSVPSGLREHDRQAFNPSSQ
jgi:hypothetical protein